MKQRRDFFAIPTNFPFVALLCLVLASGGRSNDDALPRPADLPVQPAFSDPLVMLDGRKVTDREMWINERRPVLIRLFHSLLREDWKAFLDFADEHLGSPSKKVTVAHDNSPVGPIMIDKEHPQTFLQRDESYPHRVS